jgi:hypothetical protein
MAVMAAPIVTHSALPPSLLILMVIVILGAGYFGAREYVSQRKRHHRR